MNKAQHKQYLKQKVEANPAIFRVWEAMEKAGQLENLSDEEVLKKVLDATEKVLDNLRTKK